MPLLLSAALAVVGGLVLLIWSADRFVDGAAGTARHFRMPPLLIGMVIVGFGTSAPEILVSSLAAWQGNPGLGLGNAFGSNITNIALILGVTALLKPITVQSRIVRRELPLLLCVTALILLLSYDGRYTGWDAVILLTTFAALMGWTVWEGLTERDDAMATELETDLPPADTPLRRHLLWLILGLVLLIASSRLLVWGAVQIATALGVSDLIIGLTVVAIGTSLPELASSVAAVRKNEHDLALGNIIGSNLFNSLVVVGVALAIAPTAVPAELLTRDLPVMTVLTLGLFLTAFGWRRPGCIQRWEGGLLLAAYVAYTGWLVAVSV